MASAYPIGGIRIDGDLTDWPAGLPQHPLETFLVSAPAGLEDFEGSFTVAYDEETGDLLVAVRVRDDVHRIADEGGIGRGDGCHVYFDLDHEDSPSEPDWFGAALELDSGALREEAGKPEESQRSTVGIQRVGDVTSYEWRIELGSEPLVGDAAFARTIGFEVWLSDSDRPGEARWVLWGPETGPADRGGQLGDVALLDATAFPGTIRGNVQWDDRSVSPPPRLVRVDSVDEPALWYHTTVDASGGFALEVPAGDYTVRAASGLTAPFSPDAGPRWVDRGTRVAVASEPGKTVRAEDLVLPTLEPPLPPEGGEGLLYDFEKGDPGSEGALDEVVEMFREFYGIPGVSVAVVRHGELAYYSTYGLRNVARGQEVEDTTLFEAASITKPVFAVGVMRLVERGSLDLDRPLFEYLTFPNIAADERSKQMTARHVLTHRTGLPNWAWGGPGGWRNGGELTLRYAPGEGYGYSGEGFNYLGRVVEGLSGKGLEDFLQEEVVRPMGMQQTHFSSNERLDAVASRGHFDQYVSFDTPPNGVSPASSMHTDAADMARFMISLCEGRGLQAETWAEVLGPQLELPDDAQDPSSPWPQKLGLGFFLRETPHGMLVEHGGNNGDFRCKFGVLPGIRSGYAVFTNSNHGEKLVAAVEHLMLGS